MKEKKKVIGYFALIHFLITFSASFWSYCSIYFRELGFDSRQIGWINAGGSMISIMLLPFLGVITDRFSTPKKMLLIAISVLVPARILVPVIGQTAGGLYIPILVMCVLGTAMNQVINSMFDSWGGGEMDRLGVSFGSIRRYGSFGYICGSVIVTLFLGSIFPNWTYCLFASLCVIPLLYIIGGKPGAGYTAQGRKRASGTVALLKMVCKNYYFLTYLFMVIAFDAFLGILNLDMSYLMDYVGAPRSQAAIVGGFRATTEIVIMVMLGKAKKLPPFWILLTISSLFIAMEHLLYGFQTSVWGIVAITLFSGIAGGFYYGIGANYVFHIVDHKAAATAMSVLGVIRALVGFVGASVGGDVIARYGVITLTNGVGIIALVLTGLFALSCILGRYVWKIPYVSETQVES